MHCPTIFCFLLTLSLLPLGTPFVISLPPGVQAEGTTFAGGTNYFAADLRSGAVLLVDTSTGLITTAVPPAPNRVSLGLTFSDNRLFVAGSGSVIPNITATMFVYDSVFGTTIASCPADPQGFVNDVVADSKFAYFTDSFAGTLYRLRISKLPDCDVERIPLPNPAFKKEFGMFRANGIAKFRGGVLVGNSNLATVFFIDLLNGSKPQQVLPTGSVPGTDGFDVAERDGKISLYVSQNRLNLVSEWRLRMKDRNVSAMFARNITSEDFDFPTTIALNGDILVAANGRFTTASPTDAIPEGVTFSLAVTLI